MYLFVSQFLEKDSALEPKCLVLGFVFEKKVGRPFEEKKLGGHLKKTRCHLKKQGDSALVDDGSYFLLWANLQILSPQQTSRVGGQNERQNRYLYRKYLTIFITLWSK